MFIQPQGCWRGICRPFQTTCILINNRCSACSKDFSLLINRPRKSILKRELTSDTRLCYQPGKKTNGETVRDMTGGIAASEITFGDNIFSLWIDKLFVSKTQRTTSEFSDAMCCHHASPVCYLSTMLFLQSYCTQANLTLSNFRSSQHTEIGCLLAISLHEGNLR